MTVKRTVRPWRRGEVITAEHLNDTVAGVQDALGRFRPPRTLGASNVNAEVTDDDPDAEEAATVWRWVSSRTRTVRIEDEDDADTYVDVEITTALRFRLPSGELIELQTEDPTNG